MDSYSLYTCTYVAGVRYISKIVCHNWVLFAAVTKLQQFGAIQVSRNAMGVGGGGCQFSRKKHYEGVRFNVITVTRGWVRVQFPTKKRYVTLE